MVNCCYIKNGKYDFSIMKNSRKCKLRKIITFKDGYMKKIFYECSSLISLDLSNFNINIFINMDYMFYKCNSLISFNLSKLNINNIIDMNNMIKVIQKL